MDGAPFGVKIVVFNINSCKEEGIFLTINEEYWRKDYKKKKNVKTFATMDEKYYLTSILKKRNGWALLKNLVNHENFNNLNAGNFGKKLFNKNNFIASFV